MRRMALVVLFMICSLSVSGQRLKILIFDTRFGELAGMEQIAKTINREQPDFVALFDVEISKEGVNCIAQLSGRTNRHSIFGRTSYCQGNETGVAILSKRSFEQTDLDGVVLSVIVKINPADSLRFVCAPANSGQRLAETYAGSSIPAIMAGATVEYLPSQRFKTVRQKNMKKGKATVVKLKFKKKRA